MGEPNPKYASWSKSRLFEAAKKKCVHDHWSLSEACAEFGVSKSQLHNHVKVYRAEYNTRLAAVRQGSAGPMADQLPKREIAGKRKVPSTFQEFDDYYFGHWTCPDCVDELGENCPHDRKEFHDEILEAVLGDYRRVVVNVPPFHAKSTYVTVKSVIYQIVRNPNIRIIIVSKSQTFAQTFLESITQILTNNELYAPGRSLIDDFGPFKDEGREQIWNSKQIYVAGRVSAEKDPTVQVLGVGNQIYGRRADVIIADDCADTDNQRNPEQVLKMLEWFDKMVSSRVGKRGKLIYIGTRVHAGDIYSTLRRRQGYKVIQYSAIVDDATEEVLWPEHFPYSQLMVHRAEMSTADFQLVYQNLDIPGLHASFTDEMLDAAKDMNRALGMFEPEWRIIAGLDPAGAGRGQMAFTALAVDLRTGNRFVVDNYAEKGMKAPAMRDLIFEWTEKYPLHEWRVESNGLQALAMRTLIPTPAGWNTMGMLKTGDEVFAPDGSVTTVVDKSAVRVGDTYRVEFSDGSNLVTDAGHRWFVEWASNGRVASGWTTTGELRDLYDEFPGAHRRAVPNAAPLDLPEADLPLDPYVLGMWLGDGSSLDGCFAADPQNGDQGHQRGHLEMAGYELQVDYVDRYKTRALGLRLQLKEQRLLGNKRIPAAYFRASVKQRLALLQGLMDTDGSIAQNGRADFANQNQALIDGFAELAASLGWRPRVWHGSNISRVFFHPKRGDLEPFRLERKLARVPEHNHTSSATTRRLIKAIVRVKPEPVACIRVAHHSSQFLAGQQMVPTGNSQLVQYNDEIVKFLARQGVRVVPHVTGKNKWDPKFGVEAMASLFNAGMFSIPWGNQPTAQAMQPLLDQLRGFPMAVVSDRVMSLWFAENGVRELLNRSHLPLFNERMKVPKRVRRRRHVVDFHERQVVNVSLQDQRRGKLFGTRPSAQRLSTGRPTHWRDVREVDPGAPQRFVNAPGFVDQDAV